MAATCEECFSTAEQLKGYQEILFDPSSYRAAFQDNMEDSYPGDKSKTEIFEVLKREIVDYAKSSLTFKRYLLSSLEESGRREASKGRYRQASQSFSPRIKSDMIYNPRSSSRPTVD